MSSLESFENDLLRKENRENFTKDDEFNLDEFEGQLQDAFHFAIKSNFDERLVCVSLAKIFKEYYKNISLNISKDYAKGTFDIYG